jgi:chaperonin GroES
VTTATETVTVACGHLAPPTCREETMTTATKSPPKTRLHPLDDRVIILPAEEEKAMRGGLYIPDSAREKPTRGEVLAVGPGRFERGARVKMEVAVGDEVVYGQYSGTPYRVDDEDYVIVKASDILARIG